ncbi:sigma-70 family RNA polymerase sigma factor [Roseiconus lacunae]|uniref:sigma-70 family RNA polymerase sigma factor n=1 Tax=Roseiconus lacunae TaxID=2605694 RepID=UPI0011F11E81|nr:sigma-70 family RNA polymerase sigma factor [Roseiconus lacunae]
MTNPAQNDDHSPRPASDSPAEITSECQPERHSRAAEREVQYDRFVALLARHDLAIRRFVRYLMPSTDGVDDVIQETALECWRKFDDFLSGREQANGVDDSANDEFVRWACVIARYKAMSWQRNRSRDRLVFRESVIEHLAGSAVELIEQSEHRRQAIETCLDQLSVNHRRLVLSVHMPGESVAQIAKESGVKPRQLYSKVNMLRSALLRCVERQLTGELGNG